MMGQRAPERENDPRPGEPHLALVPARVSFEKGVDGRAIRRAGHGPRRRGSQVSRPQVLTISRATLGTRESGVRGYVFAITPTEHIDAPSPALHQHFQRAETSDRVIAN